MIRLLHRHILARVLVTSLAAIGVLVFVLLAGNILRDLLGLLAAGRLTVGLFAEMVLLLLPYVFAYALPIGLLTGVLLVLGRMSARREVVAWRSAGVGLWQMSASILLLGVAGVALALFVNFSYAPQAKREYREKLGNVVRLDPLRFIVPKTFIHDFPGYVLYVSQKEGEALRDFWIWEQGGAQGGVTRLLRAREGRFTYDSVDDALVLTLKEAFAELRDEDEADDLQTLRPMVSVGETRLRLPLEGVLGARRSYEKVSALDFAGLRARENELAAELATLPPAAPPEMRTDLERRILEVRMQVQENFASAFAVLGFTLLAIPLGIRVSRTETYANLSVALAIALSYYLAVLAVGWLEEMPRLRPDLLVWLPALALQGTGLVLLHRAAAR